MHLVMQSNISSNLQTKIEQFRSVPDKNNTEKYIAAMIFNFSNKDNPLWNGMITVLNANFAN